MALVWWLLLPIFVGAALVCVAFVLLYALAVWLADFLRAFD